MMMALCLTLNLLKDCHFFNLTNGYQLVIPPFVHRKASSYMTGGETNISISMSTMKHHTCILAPFYSKFEPHLNSKLTQLPEIPVVIYILYISLSKI